MHVRERSTHRQLGRQTETLTDTQTQTDGQIDTQTDGQTHREYLHSSHGFWDCPSALISISLSTATLVACDLFQTQSHSSRPPSITPTVQITAEQSLGSLKNKENIYNVCLRDPLLLPPPCKSLPRSHWVVCKIEKIYNLCYGGLLLLSQRCRSLQSSRFVVWKYNASYRDYRENRVFVIQISLSFPTV